MCNGIFLYVFAPITFFPDIGRALDLECRAQLKVESITKDLQVHFCILPVLDV